MNDRDLTTLRQVVKQLSNHACSVLRASSLSVNDSTATTVDFLSGATVDVDTDGMFDTSSPAKLTVQFQGLYLLGAQALWENNATGRRDLYIEVDDTDVAADRVAATSALGTAQSLVTIEHLGPGAVIEMRVYQTSGGALNLVAGEGAPKLWLVRLT